MTPRRLLIGFTLSFIFCLAARPAPAEEVIEAWRSPFGQAWTVSVSTSDGSCWVSDDPTILHLTDDGTTLVRTSGPALPAAIALESRAVPTGHRKEASR